MTAQYTRDGIAGGLLLIGIGVLLLTGWWWPGIMVVLGIAVGAGWRWLASASWCWSRRLS
jgi:hypothetical protein